MENMGGVAVWGRFCSLGAVERFAPIDFALAFRPPFSEGRMQAVFDLKGSCLELREANVNEPSVAHFDLSCRSHVSMVGPESRGISIRLRFLPSLGACGARVFGDACHVGGGNEWPRRCSRRGWGREKAGIRNGRRIGAFFVGSE